jgi:tetratricopeptide (TPR) repeat protein
MARSIFPPPGAAANPIGSALKLPDPYRDLMAQQARLRAGGFTPAAAGASTPPARQVLDERQMQALVREKSPEIAEMLLRAQMREAPADSAAYRQLAELLRRLGRYAEAATLLQRALELAPDHAGTRGMYANTLFEHGREAAAIPHIEKLLLEKPGDRGHRTLLASCLGLIGEGERAIGIYEDLLKETPDDADVLQRYAHALKNAGRTADSVRALRACVTVAPGSGQAYWNLVNMSERVDDADIATLRAQVARSDLAPLARFQCHYALGHALEKSGRFEESFFQYAEGARIFRTIRTYSAAESTRQVQRAKRVFAPAFFGARIGWGCQDPAPIFILGMPRAGSTLIEQILASHSRVEGTQELPDLWHVAHDLDAADSQNPECVARLGADECDALGRQYLHRTAPRRKQGRPCFIDKLPGNWLETGFIHTILPRAKIIDARRDPMANGLALYKMYFPEGQDFSYNLTDIGRYYNDYAGFMAHIDAALPGRVHRVQYENMVADTEGEIRRLLTYCDLPFEPACLRFWETRRAVTTASAEQVRRPIFRDGLEYWRHYEPWLGELRQALSV